MIKVGIIGGAGYTAGELIRLLINHPEVEITPAIRLPTYMKGFTVKPIWYLPTGFLWTR